MQTPSIADLQARGIPFVIREHRINKNEDDKSDYQSKIVTEAMRDKSKLNRKHQKWRELFAIGWSVRQIADHEGVYETTVRRITGSHRTNAPRKMQRIQIGKIVYENQRDAMRCLKMGRERLVSMLEIGRARYVR